MSDERLKNVQQKDKSQKTADDRPSRVSEISEDEFENLLRASDVSGILPVPPKKAGWHRIWLSETAQQIPIARYERLGYTRVSPSDVDGFGQEFLKSPSGVEEVRCNEMILYEIPEDRYQKIMNRFHYEMPLELQGEPVAGAKEALRDPKTGQSLFRNEFDDDAIGETRRRVGVPKFE